ncbi:hypothetical protein B0H14DRAFT_2572205 [Mycena olivaceomarginata]|nr:hypothetical protein B0H14DRAFT_2572205 [Mycena olivaceomarginata]
MPGPRKVAFPAGRLQRAMDMQPLLMLGSAPGGRGDAEPSTNSGRSAVLVLYPVKAHNQPPPITGAKKIPVTLGDDEPRGGGGRSAGVFSRFIGGRYCVLTMPWGRSRASIRVLGASTRRAPGPPLFGG